MSVLTLEKKCNDILTDNCPCVAALTKDCPNCSLLRNDNCCDCSNTWSGLCIYNKYIHEGIKNISHEREKIIVLQKIIINNSVKIICHVPEEKILKLNPFQSVIIKTSYSNRTINLKGIILKVLPKFKLVTLIVMDTDMDIPIKYGPILRKESFLDIKVLGRVLPPLLNTSMKNILISVNGYWVYVAEVLINTLKNKNINITIIGPLSFKETIQFKNSKVDQVISTNKISKICVEFKNNKYDTLISLNTTSWQKIISSLILAKPCNKSIIFSDNQFL